MSITIRELRTEFTADTQGLAAGVARATALLRDFAAAAENALPNAVAGMSNLPARLPGARAAMNATVGAAASAPQGKAVEPMASVSVVNNWPALSEEIIRDKVLPLIEQAIRNGRIKPFKLGNSR